MLSPPNNPGRQVLYVTTVKRTLQLMLLPWPCLVSCSPHTTHSYWPQQRRSYKGKFLGVYLRTAEADPGEFDFTPQSGWRHLTLQVGLGSFSEESGVSQHCGSRRRTLANHTLHHGSQSGTVLPPKGHLAMVRDSWLS